jgi:mono/diheme cytochrome c family protein
MRGPSFTGTLLLLLFVSFTGIASSRQSDNSSPAVLRAIAGAPAKARDRQNPYGNSAEAVAAGRKLFQQHCAECHGDDARGRGSAADLHSSAVQNATPGQLAWFLRGGNVRRGMPSWSGLTEQRRWQIVAYLKSLGTVSDTSAINAPSSSK